MRRPQSTTISEDKETRLDSEQASNGIDPTLLCLGKLMLASRVSVCLRPGTTAKPRRRTRIHSDGLNYSVAIHGRSHMYSRLGDSVCDLNFPLRQSIPKSSLFDITHSVSLDRLSLQMSEMRL